MTNNTILAEHYKMKWDKCSLLVNDTFNLKYESNGLREWYELNLKNDSIALSVVIEYDGGKPGYGIYYGIRLKKANSIPDKILDTVKLDYLKNYWSGRNPTDAINCVKNVFLPDNGETSEDGTYWTFWIRLEEKYDIDEAFVGIKVILDSLIQQGFKIVS